ncbi:MAG TPA: hypothetical protein PKY38_09660 [Opitutaceae bacterium]|nr:hypothetical protein [Opitutaceae bacterium]
MKTLKEAAARSHVVSRFCSPEDLKSRFAHDVAALFEREKLGIESRELEVIVSKLPRITWLNEDRLAFLIKELGDLGASYSRQSVLKEVLEFLLVGDRQSAVFLTTKHSGLDFRKSIDLCVAIDEKLQTVIKRGVSILEEKKGANQPAQTTPGSSAPLRV